MNQRVTGMVTLILVTCTLFYIELVSDFGSTTSSGVGQHHVSGDNQRFEEARLSSVRLSSTPTEPHRSQDEYYRSFLKRQLAASENSYQEYRRRRKQYVGLDPTKVNPWPPALVMYFWDYFLPAFPCPYTLKRVGNLGDGGKWVCGMELFDKDMAKSDHSKHRHRPCIMYSFGVSTESSFEAGFLDKTDCEIWAYDASVDRMGPQVATPNPRVHFNKVYIQPNGNSTLGQLMKQNGHRWIDFLKMDIEAGEFSVMDEIMDEFEILPWAHLNLEIHGDNKGELFPKVYNMWERLEDKGLRPFMNEMNHWPCVRGKLNPIYAEYSFINTIGPSRLLPHL